MRIYNCYQRNFLKGDFITSIVAVLLAAIVMECILDSSPLMSLINGIRQSFYSVIASVAGSLLGFTIAAISIAIAFMQSPRLDLVKKSQHYPMIYKTYLAAIKYLAFTTAVAIICLLVERGTAPKIWLTYACFWGVVVSALALLRSVWILEKIIGIITK